MVWISFYTPWFGVQIVKMERMHSIDHTCGVTQPLLAPWSLARPKELLLEIQFGWVIFKILI
jgi:hypothetical protein